MTDQIEIPNKSSFKVNEVCALTGVKSYVLRFWESEFTEISPLMSSSGQKLYEHKDIEVILLIKKLLFEEKYSIERAKAEIKNLMPNAHRERSVVQDFPEEMIVENQTRRVLIDSDLKKLLIAKEKLLEIVSIAECLQEKNSWR